MSLLNKIQDILVDILDVESEDIGAETYLIRDLDAESIDLLELAVALNAAFNIDVKDDDIFFRNFRPYVNEAREKDIDIPAYLMEKLPFLTHERVDEILSDLEGGPVLKVKDLIRYVEWRHAQSA
jgi:acyl carrier protein